MEAQVARILDKHNIIDQYAIAADLLRCVTNPHDFEMLRLVIEQVLSKRKQLETQLFIMTQPHPPISDVKYITGPVSLTEHISEEYGMHVYVFGDYHTKQTVRAEDASATNTVHINTFFMDLINLMAPNIVDLLVELTYVSGKAPSHKMENIDTYINDVAQTFVSCLEVKKTPVCKSAYPNLYVHCVDVRSVEPIKTLDELWQEDNLEKIDPEALPKYIEVLDQHTKCRDLDICKISKQLANVREPTFHSEITKLLTQLDQLRPTSAELKAALPLPFQPASEDLLKEVTYIADVQKRNALAYKFKLKLLVYNKLLMDLYLLGRSFRTFASRDGRGRYKIIYVGDAHAETYRQFVTALGFTQVRRVDSEHQCLNVSGWYPWFSSQI